MKGNYAESFWTATLVEDQWSEKALANAIGDILDQLAARRSFFHQLRLEHGKAEFYVGWFFHGRGGGDVFSCDLLARLADLKIDLSLDDYPPASRS